MDFGDELLRGISAYVLQALAENGVGVAVPRARARAPATVAELMGVPAVIFMLAALDLAAATAPGKTLPLSPSAELFRKAAAAGPEAQAKFMAHAGVSVLLLLCNFCVHVSFETAGRSAHGLTEAVADELGLEFQRGEGLIEMRRRASADEHGVDAWLMQSPCEGEMCLRMTGALGNCFELRESLIGRLMEIHLLMTRNDLEA